MWSALSHRPSPRRRLRQALVLAGAFGCAQPPGFVGTPVAQDQARAAAPIARRPDAVVVEPAPTVPAPVDRAAARGVVALRQPLGADAVREVVLALVDAWRSESLDQLAAPLTSDAGPIEARSRGRVALLEGWRLRLHAHEYRRLAGADVVRVERIERYGWGELSALDPGARPSDMRPDELLVRVPLEVTRLGSERLFGDRILLILRREVGKYKIAAYGEE